MKVEMAGKSQGFGIRTVGFWYLENDLGSNLKQCHEICSQCA